METEEDPLEQATYIVAADDDDLEHQLRLRRGAPWVWKAAQEARDHGLRKFNAMQCM